MPPPVRDISHSVGTSPPIGIYAALYLLTMAFMGVTPSVDPLTRGLTPGRIYELGMLGAGLAILLANTVVRPGLPSVRRGDLLVIGGFIAWSLLSVTWSLSPLLSLGKALELLALTVAGAIIAGRLAWTAMGSRALPNVLATTSLAVLASLLLLNVYLWGTPLALRDPDGDRPRLVLGFTHPLVVADFLVLAAICLACSTFRAGVKFWGILLLSALFLLTDARGAALALLAVGVVGIVVQARKFDVRLVLAALLPTVGAVGIGLAELLSRLSVSRLAETLLTRDLATLNGRTELWSYAFQVAELEPLRGYGYQAARVVLLQYFPWSGHAHNSFVEALLGTGAVGLVLLIGFVIHVTSTAVKSRSRFLAAVLVYVLIAGMVNPLLFVPGIPMLLVLLALIHAGIHADVRTTPARRQSTSEAHGSDRQQLPRFGAEAST